MIFFLNVKLLSHVFYVYYFLPCYITIEYTVGHNNKSNFFRLNCQVHLTSATDLISFKPLSISKNIHIKVRGNKHIMLGSSKVQVIMIGKGVTFLHILQVYVGLCTHTGGYLLLKSKGKCEMCLELIQRQNLILSC